MLAEFYIKLQFKRTSILTFIIVGVFIISAIFGVVFLDVGWFAILGLAVMFICIDRYMTTHNVWYQLYKLLIRNNYKIDRFLCISYDEESQTCVVVDNDIEYLCQAYPCTRTYVGKEVCVFYRTDNFKDSPRFAYPF